jgi:hypothetical protein
MPIGVIMVGYVARCVRVFQVAKIKFNTIYIDARENLLFKRCDACYLLDDPSLSRNLFRICYLEICYEASSQYIGSNLMLFVNIIYNFNISICSDILSGKRKM